MSDVLERISADLAKMTEDPRWTWYSMPIEHIGPILKDARDEILRLREIERCAKRRMTSDELTGTPYDEDMAEALKGKA